MAPSPNANTQPDKDEVQFWLEWAGKQILSLPVNGTRPSGYGSFWPDYPDDKNTAYGYSSTRLKIASPSAGEIPLMDEILSLIIIVDDVMIRRILQARSLVTPLNNRYLYSWSRLAELLHSHRWSIRQKHRKGLEKIAAGMSGECVYRYRQTLGSPPLSH